MLTGDSKVGSCGKSFLMNRYGSWGSGKTTFVVMLNKVLQDGDAGKKWLSVEFNAGKQQGIEPVWWPLFDSIIKQSIAPRCWFSRLLLRARYWYWRIIIASGFEIIAGLLVVNLALWLPIFLRKTQRILLG